MDDYELIDKVKTESCSNSFMELVNRHSPLFKSVCSKYYEPMLASGVSPSEMEDDKMFLMYESINNFDLSKNTKYSTWLANWTRYKCLSKITLANKLMYSDLPFLEFSMNKGLTSDVINKEKLNSILEVIKEQVEEESEEIKKIFELRYFSEKRKNRRWSEIAKKIGVSTQTAINKHNQAVKRIKFKISRKNLDFSSN
jgi:DNA-directed RNA polymerase specialized sigma subunit